MKQSKPKNKFNEQTRFLFSDCWKCWNCGGNQNDCLHHIVGRGQEEGVEKSALNAAPMCNQKCHLPYHGRHKNPDSIKAFLAHTINYLQESGYKMKKIDKEFIAKYQKYYQ